MAKKAKKNYQIDECEKQNSNNDQDFHGCKTNVD